MSDKKSIAALVKQAQTGNSQALEKLFASCYNDIYYFALKTVKNEETAYDVTQEACIEIFNNISVLENPEAFTTWSRQITFRRCTRYFDKKREVLVEENEDGSDIFDTVEDNDMDFIPAEALDKEDFRKTIMDMINALSEEQRTAVMLYYFDELSVSEIAEIQGVSEGTVKSRLNYARKSIKSAVEDYEEKNGIKLHSFGLLPLLLWLRGGDMASISIPAASSALQSAISATSSVGASVSTASSAVKSATSSVAKVSAPPPFIASGTSTATSVVASTVATTATKGIATKIVAVVAAVAVAIGGGTIAIKTINDNKNRTEQKQEEHKDNQDKNSGDAVINLNKDYSNEYLELYCTKEGFNKEFYKCVGLTAEHYVTKDGRIYSFANPDTLIGQALSPDNVKYIPNHLTFWYINQDGSNVIHRTTYTENFGETYDGYTEISDLPYTLVGSDNYTQFGGEGINYERVISKDDENNFYSSDYETVNGSCISDPKPLKITYGATELTNIREITPYNAGYYVLTEDSLYTMSPNRIDYDNEQDCFVATISDHIAEGIDNIYFCNESSIFPTYTKKGDENHLYSLYFSGSAFLGGDYVEFSFPLPTDYTVDNIDTLITNNDVWLLTFDDGSVYIYYYHDDLYLEMAYLSEYNKNGAILNFYMLSNGFSEPDTLVLHMDNNNLYTYKFR